MASRAEMMRMIQLLGMGLNCYAEVEEHWKQDAYSIYYDYNTEWDKVYFVFVATEFDTTDNLVAYTSVKDYLKNLFSNQPFRDRLMQSLSLVVMGQQ